MKKLIFLLFTLLLFGCNKVMDKPDDLMNRGHFKNVLAQIYIYKQASSISEIQNLEQDKVSIAVLKKNNLSPTRFKTSLEYYMVQSGEFENILKEIQDSIKTLLPKEEMYEPEELRLNEIEVD